MHEEPIDRSRDLWIERKRRYEQEEAARRDERLDSRYRPNYEPTSRYSPPRQSNQDPRYAPPPSSASHSAITRALPSPRPQLPHTASNSDEDAAMREDAANSALKRRRLADGLDHDERREPTSGARSPPYRRGDGGPPHSAQRYLDERDAYTDDLRSPLNAAYANRANDRHSPLDRPAHSPASGGGALPPMHDAHRPSVFSPSSYDDGQDHGQSMPGLARRRGDAAQAKASRLHIDTGSNSSFEAAVLAKSSAGIAKSAPPQKLSFGFDGRDQPMPQDQSPRDQSHRPGHPMQAVQPVAHQRGEPQRLVPGTRPTEQSDLFRRDERDEVVGLREGRMPDMPHTANPLARQGPSTRMAGGAHVPQTATLPSPAYHTTQFARGPAAGRQAYNPPPTARLPDHLRSPPASKSHFLSLFSDFYDSLYDSRTLKATLEDQIKRSNTLLQTLQSSRRVLEETVERRVREERVLWEGRVRGLEARVRELESKTGTADMEAERGADAEAARAAPAKPVAEVAGDVQESRKRSRSPAPAPASGSADKKTSPREEASAGGAGAPAAGADDDEADQLQDD